VEDNFAARRTVSPGKAWVFVLLQEGHSESLVIEKRDSATQETVVAKISFGDWRKIAKGPQVKRLDGNAVVREKRSDGKCDRAGKQ
jgi:hypothetical protein